MDTDDQPSEPKPYHGLKASEPRDKRGRWIKLGPIIIPPSIAPLIPALLLRRDPAPSPRSMSPDDNAEPVANPSPVSMFGCFVVLLVMFVGLVGMLFFFGMSNELVPQ